MMQTSDLTDQQLAQIIWDFNTQLNSPVKSDIILVLGSHDLRVADRGIDLFKQRYAPLILFSGNQGSLTRDLWKKPEAEVFADEALKQGVPAEKILIENKSNNTGENIAFSLELLKQKNLQPKSFLLVQKPHMLQRTLATFRKYLPETSVSLACPSILLDEYPNEVVKRDSLISVMVGYTQRLELYSQKGFQAMVEIPSEVKQAYEELIKRGYTQHLV